MNYIEEKVEEFKRLFPCTYDQMSEDITTTHELFLRKALQEVDRRAREERDTYWKERVRKNVGVYVNKQFLEGTVVDPLELYEAITNEDNLK